MKNIPKCPDCRNNLIEDAGSLSCQSCKCRGWASVDEQMLNTFRECLENLKHTNPGRPDWNLYWSALALCKIYFEGQHKADKE